LQALIVLKIKEGNEEGIWSSLSQIAGIDEVLFLENEAAIVRASFSDVATLTDAVKSIRNLEFVQSSETRVVLRRVEGQAVPS
jgi:hypothetical protein